MGGTLTVECHSGYTFAEKPTAFTWQGERHEISKILSEAQTPHARVFRVKVQHGRVFQLTFDELLDNWEILEE